MSKTKSIEEKYKSLTDIEHVVRKPGMYIGNTNPESKQEYIIEDGRFVEKEIEYIPGVLKLVDEILSNSVDEHRRHVQEGRKAKDSLNEISVTVNADGLVSVFDNGGIPVEFHKVEGCYLPEMLFGRLRSSSNYDDTDDRIVIGSFGVGGSLTNIFSSEFIVETSDKKNSYKQTWKNNLSEKSEPIIKKSKDGYTRITFQLDMSKFSQSTIGYGLMKLIEKKCIIAAAANPGLSVTFNGELFAFNSFKEYVDLYGYETIGESNKDWEFYIAEAPGGTGDKSFSIINGAACEKGTHVKHLERRVSERIESVLKKTYKIEYSLRSIKKHYVTFINANVVNPAYDSQTKETLVSRFSIQKGNEWLKRKISKKTWYEIETSSIVDNIVEYSKSKEAEAERAQVKKMSKELSSTSIRKVSKLIDANCSKSSDRKNAELWLFEGDSAAKGFRSSRDPKTQGSYSLKGKVMNTVYMSSLSVLKNKELADIIIALGLDINDKDNMKNLRYGRVIMCSDADVDGYSICGQLITFFATHFPKLVEEGRLFRAESPIVKASKGKATKLLYNLAEYRAFSAANKGWEYDYCKGLGSLEKTDYRYMLNEPRLERMVLNDLGLKAIKGWMGNNSKTRKQFLEEPELDSATIEAADYNEEDDE